MKCKICTKEIKEKGRNFYCSERCAIFSRRGYVENGEWKVNEKLAKRLLGRV